MSGTWLFQIATFLFFLTVFAFLLGEYMAKVFSGEKTILSPLLHPVEKIFYRLFGIDPDEEMDWKSFAGHFLIFSLIGIITLFILQLFQGILPLNPEKLKSLEWDSALNTAISFVTNTDWQAYKSESTISYLTKLLGLGVQNFLSAAVGISVAIALINAFIRKNTSNIGNFWVYLTRSIIYILLPLSIVLALLLISQGSIDNLQPSIHAHTLEGKEQIIAQGPVASQAAIKNLGTNGGGFFTANAAHPYENPTPFTDYINLIALLIIAAALPFTFGALMKDRTQGWTIFIAMMLFFIAGLGIILWAESHGNPLLAKLGIHNGTNMAGKEVRFGILSSAISANATTATATGAANSAYSSFLPISWIVFIFNMVIGEVIFGGVGTGFITMLFYIMLTMFLIGLSIGRSPEIYGKKLGAYEMIIISLVLFLPSIVRFILSTTAMSIDSNTANTAFHKLSDVLYTFASTISNNGSILKNITTDSLFYNLTTAFAMLFGRLITIIPALAIAGSLIQKNSSPKDTRLPTTSLSFVVALISVILLIGALAFIPMLALGPIIEHLYLFSGQTF